MKNASLERTLTSLTVLCLLALPLAVSAAPEGEHAAHAEHAGGHSQQHLDNLYSMSYGCWGDAHQNPPLLFGVFNFLVFIAIVGIAVRKPLRNFLTARHDKIKKDLEEAAALRRQAQEKLNAMEAKVKALDSELVDIKKQAEADAEAEKRQLVLQAQRDAEQIIANAERTMAHEVERIKRQLEAEAISAAIAAAQRILNKEVSDQDHKRLAEEYFEQVGGTASATHKGAA